MVNETLARWSDLAFEAALAGYVVALLCYGIEFASRQALTPAAASGVRRGASGRAGGATTLESGGIGVITTTRNRGPAPWAERIGRAGVVVTVVAAAANVLSVVLRGVATSRLPLANMYEFTSVICAAAVICWLVVLAKTGARTLGAIVLLPVVILAAVAGSVLYTPAGPVVPALNSYWKWIHVSTISLSSSILLVAGAASVLYLIRGRLERRHAALGEDGEVSVASGGLLARLPSLEVLDRIAYRTAIVAFPVYTFAVIAGALWAEVAWGRYWGWDPKETVAFVTWVAYAAYLHARATAGWRGRRSAWISVIGFATIIFNLFFINMVVSGLHSYAGLN